MLHDELTEAKLEEILKNGKEYLALAMTKIAYVGKQCTIMSKVVFPNTREILQGILPLPFIHSQCFFKSHHVVQTSPASSNYPLAAMVGKDGKLYFRLVDVGALLGHSKVYEFNKRFNHLVIQGNDVLTAHKPYPIMTQKSKLVAPDVVFNILNEELSSLATSFAISLNEGSALVENPSNLFVESYKISPVLHVQDSPVPNLILVRLWVQTFIQKVQDMLRMQNGSKPSIQMVYEACLRAERLALPERHAQRPESMPTLPERPERIPSPLVEPERSAEPERIPTPSAENPERPVEPERPAEPERIPTPSAQRPERPVEPERPADLRDPLWWIPLFSWIMSR
ncbi:uncharacterized protein TNCV_2257291 [Trichonephila clavipes]|nr:uncharacterized protein TNCV_2257291 [Trichonephila clavipes]